MELKATMVSAKLCTDLIIYTVLSIYRKVSFFKNAATVGPVPVRQSSLFVLLQAGRSSKRQLVLFPGGIERHVKIKTCSVSVLTIVMV